MRIKEYTRRWFNTVGLAVTQKMPFEKAHYQELGIPVTPEFGMHELNALLLVNKWNVAGTRYTYYIE